MLNRLYVKNVALISEADIEFDSGLNVLSGETGSGKSVILDSINFILGCKADRTMIQYGEREAFVRAEFSVDANSKAFKKLEEYDIESDGNIIISRKLSSDGKGSIKINGNGVTVSMLKNITQHLVDVHGQSEHFFLLSEDNQLKVIDGILGESGEAVKSELSEIIARKKELRCKINSLGGNEAERARKLDLLEFQINEIETAGIKTGEFEELKSRQNLILNVEKILSAVNISKSVLNDDGGCGDLLTTAIREMSRISGFNDEYLNICNRLEGLNTEISDVAETLSDLADSLSVDESEARQVEERLHILKTLKKKYGADEEEILAFKERAKAEYDSICDSSAIIEKCTKELAMCDDEIYALCVKLSEYRKNATKSFCANVEKELYTLNIPDAKFCVNFKDFDKQTANLNSVNGSDVVSFAFSANKGEPLKPLNKVISGGEMSRFMLAVKTQLKDLNGISTYVFDEIDTGISGYTAGTVAEKFKTISEKTQILAVSHLPQACAASDAQFLIFKTEESGKTLTKIKRLNDIEKIDEIIRLTGSIASESARRHAGELIEKFKN